MNSEEAQAKFGNPKKLGFLRFIEVCFIINIVATLMFLVFISRDEIVYDVPTLLDFANVMFEGVALWMIYHRQRALRAFGIAFPLFNIIAGSLADVALGTFDPVNQLLSSVFDITLIVYFIFSRRVKTICTNTISLQNERELDITSKKRLFSWEYVRNLVMYYCVFSLVGHWMEAAMCQLIRLGIVSGSYDPSNTMLWRDWFYPFPMEGLAIVLIVILLVPFKEWLVKRVEVPVVPYAISFVANALTCALIEFTMGMFVNANLQLWDYSDMAFNFMGQVCLQNTLAFGAAASLVAWVVYPVMDRALSRVPKDVMNIAFAAIVAGYAILQCLYLINMPFDLESTITNEVDSELAKEVGT